MVIVNTPNMSEISKIREVKGSPRVLERPTDDQAPFLSAITL